MPGTRVAIIGSCISRDLWPIRGEGVDDLLYVSRTSLPSLFAPPVQGFLPRAEPPAGLTRYQHGAVLADLTKSALAQLVAHRPTHLIFDFIDERFDLLSDGRSLFTHSWELETSGYLAAPPLVGARTAPRLSEACGLLWAAGVREMAAFIAATPLREAKILLHEARWAEHYLDQMGEKRPFGPVQIFEHRPADIEGHNRLLANYERLFVTQLPQAERVAAPEYRLADERHRWGLSPFHYVDGYYDAIRRGLKAHGISFDRASAPAAPSAPAA